MFGHICNMDDLSLLFLHSIVKCIFSFYLSDLKCNFFLSVWWEMFLFYVYLSGLKY